MPSQPVLSPVGPALLAQGLDRPHFLSRPTAVPLVTTSSECLGLGKVMQGSWQALGAPQNLLSGKQEALLLGVGQE